MRNGRKLKQLAALFTLAVMCLGLAGCGGEYAEEIKTINAGVNALAEVENGHLVMTGQTGAEEGKIPGFDGAYVYDYLYRIDVRTFNYQVEKRHLGAEGQPGELIEPAYRVIDAHKYDLATGAEDEAYEGKIGDFPDLLPFYFGAGLKPGFVERVEALAPAELGADESWQGWRVYKNEKYINRVNSSRSKNGADGLMLENYVDYWLDGAGVLVRMDYVSRDAISQTDEAGNTLAEDILRQQYSFCLVSYNQPENAEF